MKKPAAKTSVSFGFSESLGETRKQAFFGPIFLVGMSRSGTQLVRDLLNQNDSIEIPVRETHFIPRILQEAKQASKPLPATYLADIVERSNFMYDLRNLDIGPTPQRVLELAASTSAVEFIEQLMRESIERNSSNKFIWGDKTPYNMLHMPLLKAAFPSARFLHIIRDPRERALSASRSWGAHPYISAQQWREHIYRARSDAVLFGDAYHEIHFEALLADPEGTVRELCQFLDINFHEDMLFLSKPADAAPLRSTVGENATRIVTDNTSKYRQAFDEATIARIEQLTAPLASELGYVLEYKISTYRPLSAFESLRVTVGDRYAKLLYFIKRWGIRAGIKFARERLRAQRGS